MSRETVVAAINALRLRPMLLFATLAIAMLPVAAVGCFLWSVNIRGQFVGAAAAGDIKTVRAMLDNGMEPDTVSHIGGIRAISMAAHSGHIDVVRLLLARGANPTYGLPQAERMHRVDIVRLLLAQGAKVPLYNKAYFQNEPTIPEDKTIDRLLQTASAQQNGR